MVNESEGRSWYLLTSKPNQDQRAQEQLMNQGYEVYRPMAVRNRRRRGKLIKVQESLFPRYMFIHLDTENDNWAPIKSTYGVSGVVNFGLEPAKVPESIVNSLKASARQFEGRTIDLDHFANGDPVLIEEGPFQGMSGIFKHYSGQDRVIVLLNIMSLDTPVDTSVTSLSRTC